MSGGLFITLEGGEGSGKSTQIKALSDKLRAAGYDVITTREPGGTPEAEKIRDLLVKRDGGNWTPEAEILLLFAARHMHVEKLIKPALAAGKIVISDRFTDSTRAYQCYGHGVAMEMLEGLDLLTLDGFKPELTFILDIPVEKGLARAGKRMKIDKSTEDRFENLDVSFHERLRQGYLAIAKKEPERCVIVDAARKVEEITNELFDKICHRLSCDRNSKDIHGSSRICSANPRE